MSTNNDMINLSVDLELNETLKRSWFRITNLQDIQTPLDGTLAAQISVAHNISEVSVHKDFLRIHS